MHTREGEGAGGGRGVGFIDFIAVDTLILYNTIQTFLPVWEGTKIEIFIFPRTYIRDLAYYGIGLELERQSVDFGMAGCLILRLCKNIRFTTSKAKRYSRRKHL